MLDQAPGPASGYIYQFELALAMLASLDQLEDILSIEKIDDVAIENEDDIVIMSIQTKHSISPNGTTFEDTSKALWRTIEIWIQKIQSKEVTSTTAFICATNKTIPADALVKKIQEGSLEEVRTSLNALIIDQKKKLKEFRKKDKEKGRSIAKTIKWVQFALDNWDAFSIIKNKIEVWDSSTPKEKFLNKIHMAGSDHTQAAKDNVYQTMLGWIISTAKAKWMQADNASLTKRDFDRKYQLVCNSPSLVLAVFRKKIDLRTLSEDEIKEKKSELFVKQIEDIKRRKEAKERKIEDAIINFLYHDIEISHILTKGNVTKKDFDEFRGKCKKKWENCFDSFVTKELEDYSEEEKYALAISIYDEIMDKIEVKFMEDISFNTDNRYIHNGTFLKLSNVPEIGWHPEWKTKYIKGS